MNKVLMYGNGINQVSNELISWKNILKEISLNNNLNNYVPNTMLYEKILINQNYKNELFSYESEIKKNIAKLMFNIPSNDHYNLIYNLGFKNYITTNYDYSLNKKLEDLGFKTKNNSTEDLYSIRRNTSFINSENKEVCKIWNIHGEINYPSSIMLGLDHYCGAIGKVDAYLKGTYEFNENKIPKKVNSIKNKIIENKFDAFSWIDFFFNSNIYILGFSLDYSEIDLWRILNKRARIISDNKTSKLIKNKIYFYDVNIEKEKKEVLESFKINVVNHNVKNINTLNWSNYYKNTLIEIKNR